MTSLLRLVQCINMRTGSVLQLALLLALLLAGPSEEFFFEYPRKALMEFFQSLKTKKQPAKMNVQHYHVHYYPMPVPLLAWTGAPEKRDLDKLYSDTIRSFGWADYQYKFAPDPLLIISSRLQQLSDNPSSWNQDILESEDVQTSIDRNIKGILLQVPVNQQIVLKLLKKSRKEATT
ncbi:uncharacterized protein LOC105180724 isoform X1 [Harpegnathos saltator]|nr:uncharacterized protein LOC105180724 isoform X1 [Harpegnathos saltator]